MQSDNGAERVLDEAQRNGMTVQMGIWIGHPRHGFDYSDRDAVKRQREMVREAVRTYKDHPALLSWGVVVYYPMWHSALPHWSRLECPPNVTVSEDHCAHITDPCDQ